MIHRVKRELMINVLNEGMKLKISIKNVKEFGNWTHNFECIRVTIIA